VGNDPDIGAYEYGAEVPAVDPVVVITTSVFVGTTTATSGGNVTSEGGGTVTARGVCWGTSANPLRLILKLLTVVDRGLLFR